MIEIGGEGPLSWQALERAREWTAALGQLYEQDESRAGASHDRLESLARGLEGRSRKLVLAALRNGGKGAQCRLAVYGTLAPGEPNHEQLQDLIGEWTPGAVWGRLERRGWGAEMGYPGLSLDPSGDLVMVSLFRSPDLCAIWEHLDLFEGPSYRRILAPVVSSGEVVLANLYTVDR